MPRRANLREGGRAIVGALGKVKRLAPSPGLRHHHEMDGMTREERLAAKLRENLRRRKTQARALGESADTAPADTAADPATALSKAAPDS